MKRSGLCVIFVRPFKVVIYEKDRKLNILQRGIKKGTDYYKTFDNIPTFFLPNSFDILTITSSALSLLA